MQLRGVGVGFGFNVSHAMARPIPRVLAGERADRIGVAAEPSERVDRSVKPQVKMLVEDLGVAAIAGHVEFAVVGLVVQPTRGVVV